MAKKKLEDPLYNIGDILYSDMDKENVKVIGIHENPKVPYNSYKVVVLVDTERMTLGYYTRSEDELHRI